MHAADLGLLVLRLIVGPTMFAHGFNKVRNGVKGTAGWFESIGMKPGRLNAWLAAGNEMAMGVLLTLGLLTPLAGAMLVGVMTVAGLVDHRGKGFFIFRPGQGWEYVLVLGGVGVALGSVGPGSISLDHVLGIDDPGWWGFGIAAGVGLLGALLQLAVFYRPPKKAAQPA